MALSEGAATMAKKSAEHLYMNVSDNDKFAKPVIHQVVGVRLDVRAGVGDELVADKIGGMRLAVHKVAKTGLLMPPSISIYTSSDRGFLNVAFQRDIGGAQKASICLGGKLANSMELPIGMATIYGKGSILNFCAAVCVHEIGHILHEMADPEFFWSDAANAATPPRLGGQVSTYASSNIREFVAEIFTGMIYGERFSVEVINKYAECNGPAWGVGVR